MTRSKLSDPEKQEIVSLFEANQETISSLALRYEVSASTIRRLLKQTAPEKTPAIEITAPSDPPVVLPAKSVPKPISKRSLIHPVPPAEPDPTPARSVSMESPTLASDPNPSNQGQPRRQMPLRRRDKIETQEVAESVVPRLQSGQKILLATDEPDLQSDRQDEYRLKSSPVTKLAPPADDISEIIREISHELDGVLKPRAIETDVEDEDVDDDDFEDLDDEGDDFEDFASSSQILQVQPEFLLEVMPLADAVFPKTCYLVIDRTAELVTRPLKDFGELGQIPSHEIQARTLPVFDNHRIARRFSHRTQRIIKVPNGNMIKATCAQLSAKGITRLLVNGRIYAI